MWHIMADMICHKVYEFLISILNEYNWNAASNPRFEAKLEHQS